jgi:hypothetical protein
MTVLKTMNFTPGGELPTLLDQDGLYFVAAVVHTGDTRGNEWYTDITGFNTATGKAAIAYLAQQGAGGMNLN